MPLLNRRLTLVILLAVAVSGCAAGRAFRKGEEATRAGNWDQAVAEYTRAVQEKPGRAEYKIALERATQNAAREHIIRAQELESKDQLDAALLEYKRAMELDGSNRLAAARSIELEKTIRDRIEATRPKPAIEATARRGAAHRDHRSSARRRRCRSSASVRTRAYATSSTSSGTATGINVTYDQAYRTRPTRSGLEDVTLEQALQQIMAANQLFYKVLNPKTIIVVPDNAQKHAQYDDLVVRVFYISHADVVGAGADAQHHHAHPDHAGAADAAAEQDGEHHHRARDERQSSMSSSGSSGPTTSRAPRS